MLEGKSATTRIRVGALDDRLRNSDRRGEEHVVAELRMWNRLEELKRIATGRL